VILRDKSPLAICSGDFRDVSHLARKVRGHEVHVIGEIFPCCERDRIAGEVTRVAREVGHRRQARRTGQVFGVGGTWKDLTDNVNFMASNLTGQVRNIAEVATAIASGDCRCKITVDVRGEILQLKETLNTMVDQLNRFAGEVTRVPASRNRRAY